MVHCGVLLIMKETRRQAWFCVKVGCRPKRNAEDNQQGCMYTRLLVGRPSCELDVDGTLSWELRILSHLLWACYIIAWDFYPEIWQPSDLLLASFQPESWDLLVPWNFRPHSPRSAAVHLLATVSRHLDLNYLCWYNVSVPDISQLDWERFNVVVYWWEKCIFSLTLAL